MNHPIPVRLFACAAVLLALLAGCDDDDTPAATAGGATVSGGVVKGPVSGSTVCAYAVTGGAKGAKLTLTLPSGAAGSVSGGCFVTPANGAYNFALPAGTTGDVLLEASGGDFCSNEQIIIANACAGGGTKLSLGGAVLTSVVNVGSGNATVYTTPLTTAAVNAAGGALSGTTFNSQFNTLAGRVIGPASGVTPQTQPNATNQPYLTQVASYLQGGGTLTAAVSSLQQGTTSFPAPGAGGAYPTSPATVNASIAAIYNLKFYKGNGQGCGASHERCPYDEAQDVPVTVFADGRLSIPGKTLTNPFYRDFGGGPHLPEVIWLDSAANLEYALTDNQSGHFSEINVSNASQAIGQGFLGQIRMPETPASTALQQVAGTYSLSRQYAGVDVTWTSVTVGTDGAVSFTGPGTYPNITTGNVGTVSSFISCCNRLDIISKVELNGDSSLDSDDRVSFYLGPDGVLKDVEYYVGATNVSTSLRGVSVVGTNTLPAIESPGTATWAIPTSNQITGVIGSATVAVSVTSAGGTPNGGIQLMAEEGSGATLKSWVINIVNPAGNLVNTNYSCVHGSRTKYVQLKTNSSDIRSSKEGGNCNVYITRIEAPSGSSQITAVEGRFTAELYDFSRKTTTLVTQGAFRWVQPAP